MGGKNNFSIIWIYKLGCNLIFGIIENVFRSLFLIHLFNKYNHVKALPGYETTKQCLELKFLCSDVEIHINISWILNNFWKRESWENPRNKENHINGNDSLYIKRYT